MVPCELPTTNYCLLGTNLTHSGISLYCPSSKKQDGPRRLTLNPSRAQAHPSFINAPQRGPVRPSNPPGRSTGPLRRHLDDIGFASLCCVIPLSIDNILVFRCCCHNCASCLQWLIQLPECDPLHPHLLFAIVQLNTPCVSVRRRVRIRIAWTSAILVLPRRVVLLYFTCSLSPMPPASPCTQTLLTFTFVLQMRDILFQQLCGGPTARWMEVC